MFRSLIKGLLTFIPFYRLYENRKRPFAHSSKDAYFCYSFWFGMLSLLDENKIDYKTETVLEIGNGGSFGIGLCALLTGTKKYYSVDLDKNIERIDHLQMLDQMVSLLKQNKVISEKYLQINIKLKDHNVKDSFITKRNYLDDDFVEEIRLEIQSGFKIGRLIEMIDEKDLCEKVDFICSRAVIEHLNDPEVMYKNCFDILKPNGIMFHDIELHAHGVVSSSEKLYQIPSWLWILIRGRRKYFLNRWELTDHLHALKNTAFRDVLTFINPFISNNNEIQGMVLITRK